MFKTLIKELKRYNDIKEKELDLKILSPFDYEKKWGVYPTQFNLVLILNVCAFQERNAQTKGVRRDFSFILKK